ncbi:FtsX-like permease family protein [Clostridium sp. LP20]|uniref:FtsX-like permease family protein n=1 Tax=Clostridium sp. LP20 TaxID=3418665 RepID=UPI003EE48B1A
MKNALAKDTVREIKKSFGRFLSIFAIVGIGVAFFAGVKAAAPDMKYTADKYYDDYNLMDIRLLSTMGLTKDDVEEIKNIQGIKGIYPTHSFDTITKMGSSEIVLKLHGLPIDNLSEDNEGYINRPKLVEGRFPEKSGECLVENGKLGDIDLPIGSKITLESGTSDDILDSLNTKEYTVVGVVETPYYLSFEKGSSSIGNGSVNSFLMIPEEDFKMDVFTEVLLTIDGAKEINSYSDEYFEVTGKIKDRLVDLGKERGPLRIEELKDEANKKLAEGKEEYTKGKEKLEDELSRALNKIESSKLDLLNAEKKLNEKESDFPKLMEESKRKIADGEKKLSDGEIEYARNLEEYNNQKAQAEKMFALIEEQINKIKDEINSLEEKLKNPDLSPEEKKDLENKHKQLVNIYNQSTSYLQIGKDKLTEGENQLQAARIQLDNGKKELELQKTNLVQGEIDAKKGFEEGRNKIEAGKAELKKGEEEYLKGKAQGEEELAIAEEKLLNSEKRINEMKEPEWIVLDRNSHYSYVDYGGSADRIDAISKVFPLFFFLVAALVCLTTMTRMVDEQRGTIGTLKALGYSKISIASKYIAYAATASIGGSIFGLALGMTLFPTVIFNAYGIMYTLPSLILKFEAPLALGTTIVAVLITTLAAVFACYKELVETPSLLMRPRAPKEGKRILLERITFLWKRFSFTEKVTARNIFRYKKRFFMTVIGISGCSALLLAGFGIKDSIKTIAYKQFGEIIKYDASISFEKDSSLKEKEDILDKYSKDSRVDSIMKISQFSGNASVDGDDKRVNLIVPSDVEEFKNYTELRSRSKKKEEKLSDDGVILSEKLARGLKVKKGDKVKLDNGDGYQQEVAITGITEAYVDHYVYMSPEYYKNVFGERADYNTLVAKLKDKTDEVETSLGSEIMNDKGVKSVYFYSGIVKNFENTISSLNIVVIVLIISAGALAFVVLYNLTNVNISERLREIATIKVLGFYDNEVSAYVYRENIILTIIGSIVGLGLGAALHQFIMITVEMENVMFGRNINILSYLYAVAITLLFAVLVNLVMYHKLKKIPMVESLKSVE